MSDYTLVVDAIDCLTQEVGKTVSDPTLVVDTLDRLAQEIDQTMNGYTLVVDAVDRLAQEVSKTNYAAECLSTVLATVGSVLAVLIFEIIKDHIFVPRTEFRKLRRKVNSTLAMHARYYTNPLDNRWPMASERTIEDYINAEEEVRKLGVDVIAFADEMKGKKCCGIPVKDIRAAGRLLIGLSNNFRSSGDCSERDDNKKYEAEIKKLLAITKKEE